MPTKLTRRLVIATPVVTAAALATRPLLAADAYPSRTITLIVPYGAGSGVDTSARIIAPRLSEKLKQTVVVINKPGAGAIIGTEYASHAVPDGYTLLFNSVDMVISPAIYQDLPYDPVRDFMPVTELVTVPLFVVVKGDSPIKAFADLLAYVKAHPEKANYAASSGLFWATTALVNLKAGINATRVPYRDAGAMTLSLIAGEVLFAVLGTVSIIGHVRTGAIRVLATIGPQRVPIFPDVPTLAELGISGVNVSGWHGIWTPAKTPPAIIETLNHAAREVLASPEVHADMQKHDLLIVGSSIADFQREITSELALWKEVATKANISIKR